MHRLAANLSMLFQELEFPQRFAAAKAAGFHGVEFMYQPDLGPTLVTQLLEDHGLEQVLANMPGHPADKGLAAAAGRQSEFRERFEQGLAAAVTARSPLLHVTAGVVEDSNYADACETFLENMWWAGARAKREKVALVIEAINQADVPGYFIRSLSDAIAWCERLSAANVRLILDLYHAAKAGLNLPEAVHSALPKTKHIQIAGVPNRDEPIVTGELANALAIIDRESYGGWIGCEYKPRASTVDGLTWIQNIPVLGR